MDIANIKILIVDDEEDLAEIVSESFGDEDLNSTYCTSGEAALELIGKDTYHVIISDSHMPGMTGMELLDKIGSDKELLFYLATGDVDAKEEEIKALGGNGLIPKPYDINEVIDRIKRDLA